MRCHAARTSRHLVSDVPAVGSLNWEPMGLGRTDSKIPAPWANYGGSTTCCAGTWHALVSILGKSGGSVSFGFSDVSGSTDVHESDCARRT